MLKFLIIVNVAFALWAVLVVVLGAFTAKSSSNMITENRSPEDYK